MNKKQIIILHLYPKDMNIYGDYGNIMVIKRRLEWYGYNPIIIDYNQGDKLPGSIDIVIGGGGQYSGQDKIKNDLIKIGPKLKSLAENNTPMLMICGLYQLFGNFFKNDDGEIIPGIGLFDAETTAGPNRLIGNITTYNKHFGIIIGYENHSGQTILGKSAEPFGVVRQGDGNNIVDDSEGAIYKNVIGSYIHGSLLPKNPAIADFLIKKAVINKYGDFDGKDIDDSFADAARKIAIKRPR